MIYAVDLQQGVFTSSRACNLRARGCQTLDSIFRAKLLRGVCKCARRVYDDCRPTPLQLVLVKNKQQDINLVVYYFPV